MGLLKEYPPAQDCSERGEYPGREATKQESRNTSGIKLLGKYQHHWNRGGARGQ